MYEFIAYTKLALRISFIYVMMAKSIGRLVPTHTQLRSLTHSPNAFKWLMLHLFLSNKENHTVHGSRTPFVGLNIYDAIIDYIVAVILFVLFIDKMAQEKINIDNQPTCTISKRPFGLLFIHRFRNLSLIHYL